MPTHVTIFMLSINFGGYGESYSPALGSVWGFSPGVFMENQENKGAGAAALPKRTFSFSGEPKQLVRFSC